jgi:transcriptional regulator with XRE-family HTH domain
VTAHDQTWQRAPVLQSIFEVHRSGKYMQEKSRKDAASLADSTPFSKVAHRRSASKRTLEQAIGVEVRYHRKASNLTVAELALAAKISPGMLSKIENGQISPSLTTLQTLAAALNVPLTLLFTSYDQRRDCSVVKSGQGLTIRRRGTKAGHHYLLGFPLDGDLIVEPFLITLSEASVAYTGFRHDGVEFIFMLTGEVEYAHGESTYRLAPGDAIMFDSAARHGPSRIFDSNVVSHRHQPPPRLRPRMRRRLWPRTSS